MNFEWLTLDDFTEDSEYPYEVEADSIEEALGQISMMALSDYDDPEHLEIVVREKGEQKYRFYWVDVEHTYNFRFEETSNG